MTGTLGNQDPQAPPGSTRLHQHKPVCPDLGRKPDYILFRVERVMTGSNTRPTDWGYSVLSVLTNIPKYCNDGKVKTITE